LRGIGRYNVKDQTLGIGNDKISSIRVPSGLQITVWEHGDFKGASRTWSRDVECLKNERMSTKKSWNDQVSSFEVRAV
jgi:hypothetical protein